MDVLRQMDVLQPVKMIAMVTVWDLVVDLFVELKQLDLVITIVELDVAVHLVRLYVKTSVQLSVLLA